MRSSFLASAILFVMLFAFAALGQSSDSWQKVTSTEGKFEAFFPVKPQESKNSFDVGDTKVVMSMMTAEFPQGAFLVSYTDLSENVSDPAEALLTAQKGSVMGVNGTLISSESATFMGYPARTFKVRVNPFGDLNLVASVKAVLVDKRLYQVAVVGSEANVESPEFNRFVSSFKLLTPAAVAKK